MGRVNLKVDSVSMDRVLEMLERVENIPASAEKALEAGAKVLLPVVVQSAPVRSGELKKALKVGRRRRGKAPSVEVGVFYPDAPYAHLVEGGHGGEKHAPAHPFMQPSAKIAAEEVFRAVVDALKGMV